MNPFSYGVRRQCNDVALASEMLLAAALDRGGRTNIATFPIQPIQSAAASQDCDIQPWRQGGGALQIMLRPSPHHHP